MSIGVFQSEVSKNDCIELKLVVYINGFYIVWKE